MKTETQVREFRAHLIAFGKPDRSTRQWIRVLNWVLDSTEVMKE